MKERKIFSNVEIKVACVLIAAALWLYSWQSEREIPFKASVQPQTRRQWYVNSVRIDSVPVEIKGENGRLKLAQDKVTITVKVPDHLSLDEISSIKAEIRADRIKEGDESVEILDTDFVLPKGMVLLYVEPRKIEIIRR
ncbi:TPA: hypothetical protein ENG04_09440 [Candidatus Poribacteria bacterium]|nr:hypothetical protein [Candidatus Poribacteria bacterium]HEX30289.1 hypothetical protein [Candidatus Poribacteria bacterium]